MEIVVIFGRALVRMSSTSTGPPDRSIVRVFDVCCDISRLTKVAVVRGQVAKGNTSINVVGEVPTDVERNQKETSEQALAH